MTEPSSGVSFPRVARLHERFEATYRAVYEASGRPPTHFLVGWMTLGQFWLEVADRTSYGSLRPSSDREAMFFHGLKLVLDPTRAHAIVAVPVYDFVAGGRLPPGAVWEGP